jgi:hypothetical protein
LATSATTEVFTGTRAEQLVLHAEFADALHGRGEFGAGDVRPVRRSAPDPEREVEGGPGLLAPLLELEDRHAELARNAINAWRMINFFMLNIILPGLSSDKWVSKEAERSPLARADAE